MKEIVINKEIIRKLLEKGLSVNSLVYLLLCQENEEELIQKIDLSSGIATNYWLLTNGYILTNNTITEKSKKLIEELFGKVSNKIDISNKWHDLHKELQDTLFQLTGKKQAKANGDYTFLCNERDLQHKLARVITKYKLTDWEKIKKLLVLHIHKAYKQKFEKVFLVQYYIEKNGMSALASDYENFVEKEEGIIKKEELTNTKELF